MRLAAEQVHVTFAETTALHDVSFVLGPGELVVVAGPNGSGKTTLLRTLLGLIRPAAGRVLLDDRELHRWTRRELASVIGALPQREEPAFPLTVREALLMGRWGSLGPLAPVGVEDDNAIAGALRRCDVSGFEGRTTESLSGGEWQRVRLARALASRPRLLLLDEPTAALDIGHEMELFALLRELVRDGLGILAITHDLNLAVRYADRAVLMRRGRVAAEGDPAAVITSEIVSEVFDWPVMVHQWPDIGRIVLPLPKSSAAPTRTQEPPC